MGHGKVNAKAKSYQYVYDLDPMLFYLNANMY